MRYGEHDICTTVEQNDSRYLSVYLSKPTRLTLITANFLIPKHTFILRPPRDLMVLPAVADWRSLDFILMSVSWVIKP